MPRRKKDQPEAETENLLLPVGESAAPEEPAAEAEAAPRARRAAPAPGSNNGNGRPALDAGRRNAIDKALTDLTKRFGDGAIMRLGEAKHMNVESIPTGSLALDLALGIGGVPRGRVTEIYGPESAGKTTVCQHIVAEAQRRGGVCGYIDMEHALDPIYAARCGVDVENQGPLHPSGSARALSG